MAYNAQGQQVSYVVNDGTGTTASITVTCDPNGASGSIGCPVSGSAAAARECSSEERQKEKKKKAVI